MMGTNASVCPSPTCNRASIYDVRRGWREGVPKKQMKGTKSAVLTVTRGEGEGIKTSENFADIIYEAPCGKPPSDQKRRPRHVVVCGVRCAMSSFYLMDGTKDAAA